jgi:membrane protein implicated in regulation of membrane protease activity
MREALEEFLVVLAYSTKTWLAVIFGLAFFVGKMLAGDYFISHLGIHGIPAPLTDVVREKIAHRYDKVAWASLASFLILAIKCYKKDRKRLLGF